LSVILIITGVIVAAIKTHPKVVSLSEKGLPTGGVNLIAHRGFSAVAPEN
jgi:glycerophosphoryl diester phosphodiesterase